PCRVARTWSVARSWLSGGRASASGSRVDKLVMIATTFPLRQAFPGHEGVTHLGHLRRRWFVSVSTLWLRADARGDRRAHRLPGVLGPGLRPGVAVRHRADRRRAGDHDLWRAPCRISARGSRPAAGQRAVADRATRRVPLLRG